MSRSLYEPSPARATAANRFQIKDTRQKPLAFRWWQPDCIFCEDLSDDDNCANPCDGDEPPLLNGFAQPSNASDLEKFAFRLHADGSLEFKGHLDAQAAASGDVAFVLPGANAGEVDFRLANDQNWHTTIRTAPGSGPTSFTLALVEVIASTGDVIIYWPAV